MQPALKHIRWMPVLMTLSTLAIAAFQVYWLQKAYQREERTLDIRTNMALRETVYTLQSKQLKLDKLVDTLQQNRDVLRQTEGPEEMHIEMRTKKQVLEPHPMVFERIKEAGKTVIITNRKKDSSSLKRSGAKGWNHQVIQFLYDMDSPKDSLKVTEISSALKQRLQQQGMDVPFSVTRLPKPNSDEPVFHEVTVGFHNPITYKVQLGNTTPYLSNKILTPILLSIFLVCFTVVSFSLLYHNLQRQRRLADIKNEFISNITHELKTPIATVSVAIEALRSFNSSLDPQKTKEYLDISANELQRLSLLVDKVLKLSMFENKEIELRYEPLDMKTLLQEVTASLRLQFEKYKVQVDVVTEGDTRLEGDRLHLVSIIYNLIDNAMKYSNSHPKITIRLAGLEHSVNLLIQDAGIGIPAEYKDKVFDKFFRVPTGNVHNAKGYGLGLSYVSHVVKKHRGTIKLESTEGLGSTFIVSLPKHKA